MVARKKVALSQKHLSPVIPSSIQVSPGASLISPVPICSGGGDPHVLPGGLVRDGGHCVTAQWSSKHSGRATNEYKACLHLGTNVNTCSGWDIDGELGTPRCLARWIQTISSYCRHCEYKYSAEITSGIITSRKPWIWNFNILSYGWWNGHNRAWCHMRYSFGKTALFITWIAEFFLSEWAKRTSWPIVCQGDELLDWNAWWPLKWRVFGKRAWLHRLLWSCELIQEGRPLRFLVMEKLLLC